MSERLEATVEGLSHEGGVAVLADGRRLFVPRTAPGDRIALRVIDSKKGPPKGELLELLQPGARVPPPCPFVERCGGCGWQHVAPQAQLAEKERAFREALVRLGGIEPAAVRLLPIEASPAPFGYRIRARFGVQGRRVGPHAARSHDLVEVDSCALLHPALDALLQRVRAAIAVAPIHGATGIEAVIGGDGRGSLLVELDAAPSRKVLARVEKLCKEIEGIGGVVLRGGEVKRGALAPVLFGDPVVKRPAAAASGHSLQLRADVFAQANAAGNERLVAQALVWLQPTAAEHALELFSGAGNFTLPLALAAGRVTAIESEGPALQLASRALAVGQVKNVRLVTGDATKLLQGLAAEGARFDVALLDPPRTGAKGLAAALAGTGVTRLVYVSCDPATLGRDLKELQAQGFTVTDAQPFDLFPQTPHVEGLVRLQRR